ncbi:MAG: ATP-binding protein [Saprospiraceae bacterium]
MAEQSTSQLQQKIINLEQRLGESEQLIEAIKAGEVDAFAIQHGDESQIYTLQSGDYAFRHLIEEVCEGAINVTQEGLIVYTNKYFFDLLGFPYEKVIATSIFEFIHEDSKTHFNKLFAEAITGKSKGEINLLGADGILPVYISLTSLLPKLENVGIIVTDLTHKKKNEKVLLEYQESLEQKNIELIQSNTDLASFAYVASHDLQEPLRKIQTFATRILEKEMDTLSESGKDHFQRMQLAAERMQTLIEDLLTYSRTNTAERKFEYTDLNEIIDDVKLEMKENLVQKDATIVTHKMCKAYVIPFQFRQLLNNLISNSLKFASPSRAPFIDINSEIINGTQVKNNLLEPEKKYCHISISDNGIGFEQQYSEKIFELFQRLHGKLTYQGTGIGLAIVKKIVDNHSGIITAESEEDKGARFDIYLPVG